jgi:hypothetical protein
LLHKIILFNQDIGLTWLMNFRKRLGEPKYNSMEKKIGQTYLVVELKKSSLLAKCILTYNSHIKPILQIWMHEVKITHSHVIKTDLIIQLKLDGSDLKQLYNIMKVKLHLLSFILFFCNILVIYGFFFCCNNLVIYLIFCNTFIFYFLYATF